MSKKPSLRPDFGALAQFWVANFFLKNLVSSVTRYRGQESPCTISEKTNGPVLRKFSDGQMDRPKRVIS